MPQIATLTLNPALDIGTATAEVRATVKLRCDAPQLDPGGGGVNVARVVHALGGDALTVLPVGGVTGQRLEALLREDGTPFEAVPISGETRESLCVTDRGSGAQYRFVLPGPELTEAEQRACVERLTTLSPAPHFVVVSGSLPPGTSPDLLAGVGAWCLAIGARSVLDLPGPALRLAVPCNAFLVKPNLEELEELVGYPVRREREEERVVRHLVETGYAEMVLLSLGARGVLIANGSRAMRLAAPRSAAAQRRGRRRQSGRRLRPRACDGPVVARSRALRGRRGIGGARYVGHGAAASGSRTKPVPGLDWGGGCKLRRRLA